MAAQMYLITKDTPEKRMGLIDGVHSVILNADDGDTAAVRRAEAEALCVAQGVKVPAGYFDTIELLGPPTGGAFEDDGDGIIIGSDFVKRFAAD